MIKLKNLKKKYGDTIAVKDFSLEIAEGEIIALIGTSGCGKTTTLKMINRLIEPSNGSIQLDNKQAVDLPVLEWRRKFGYVIQKSGLLPHLTVEQNICLLAHVLKQEPQSILDKCKQNLELVSLPYSEFSKRFPKELSGGQQQRVGIARALMQSTKFLLMDEPFGALDPLTKYALHDEVISLNKKLNSTIIMVTHDLQEACQLASRIVLMDQGEIVEIGDPAQLQKKPSHQFTKDFFKAHHNA